MAGLSLRGSGTCSLKIVFILAGLGFMAGCAMRSPSPQPVATSYKELYPPATISKLRPYEIDGVWYYPLPSAAGYREEGLASWYGPEFHNKPTANGERFNMYAMTAAHRTLPLGTLVRVTNLRNHRVVIVRINDRGPFIKGRIIDLSYGAAKALGFTREGLVPVRIEAIGFSSRTPPYKTSVRSAKAGEESRVVGSAFTIQIGAFKDKERASELKNSLSSKYGFVRVEPVECYGRFLYRVQVGCFESLYKARRELGYLKSEGFKDAFVVVLEGR